MRDVLPILYIVCTLIIRFNSIFLLIGNYLEVDKLVGKLEDYINIYMTRLILYIRLDYLSRNKEMKKRK